MGEGAHKIQIERETSRLVELLSSVAQAITQLPCLPLGYHARVGRGGQREAIIEGEDTGQVHLDPDQPSLHRSERLLAFSITHFCASEKRGPSGI